MGCKKNAIINNTSPIQLFSSQSSNCTMTFFTKTGFTICKFYDQAYRLL